MDSTIPSLHVPEISSLCQTWSESPKAGFLTMWLIYDTEKIAGTAYLGINIFFFAHGLHVSVDYERVKFDIHYFQV